MQREEGGCLFACPILKRLVAKKAKNKKPLIKPKRSLLFHACHLHVHLFASTYYSSCQCKTSISFLRIVGLSQVCCVVLCIGVFGLLLQLLSEYLISFKFFFPRRKSLARNEIVELNLKFEVRNSVNYQLSTITQQLKLQPTHLLRIISSFLLLLFCFCQL